MDLPYIPRVVPVQPVVLITGFLGAGKTTLLKELLIATKAGKIKSSVILNDYADAALDSSRLKNIADSIEPLTAACACCDGLDFLLELSLKTKKVESDILFVELNGTADPVPVIESFTLLEDKLSLNPRWQVCVIDVRYFGKRGTYRDVEELQLQTASHICFTHEEPEFDREEILQDVKAINPYAMVVERNAFIKDVICLAEVGRKETLASSRERTGSKADFVKISDKHQQTHGFASCQIRMPRSAKEQMIRDWLASLPSNVIRAKLLIGVDEKPRDRYLFERVSERVSRYPQRVELDPSVPNSAILIGPNLNIEKLENLTREYFNEK